MNRSRRNFITVSGAGALGVLLSQCRRASESTQFAPQRISKNVDGHWSGIGFGIEMSAEWYGVSEQLIPQLNAMIERTISALESAFSLYSDSSELSRLNRERELLEPSALFIELLTIGGDLSKRTFGLYQPAIHGAWNSLSGDGFPADWKQRIEASSLEFVKQEVVRVSIEGHLTELSYNALVQGFLADKVANSARALGVKNALLHLGETYGIGGHPEGRDWSLAVMGTPVDGEIDLVGAVDFSDAGLAVSAHDLTRKLVNPNTGGILHHDRVVAVTSSEGATTADAFATAFAVAEPNDRGELFKSLSTKRHAAVKIWEQNKQVFESNSAP